MVAHEREMFGSQRGVTGTEEPQGGGDRVRLSVSEYLHALEDVNNNNNNNNDDDDDDDDDNDDDCTAKTVRPRPCTIGIVPQRKLPKRRPS